MIRPSTCRDCRCVSKSFSCSIESWLSAKSVDRPCRSAKIVAFRAMAAKNGLEASGTNRPIRLVR